MKFQIDWTAFLNVKNEIKANKLINQIEKAISQKTINRKMEEYWKDNSKIKADFRTSYEEDMSIEEVVFKTLSLVNNIGVLWSVYSPSVVSAKDSIEIIWAFEGICNDPRIPGVTWVQFILSTDGKREYGWDTVI